MGQNFKETAHLHTDLKKLHENWDEIDWNARRVDCFYCDISNKINKDAVSFFCVECQKENRKEEHYDN